MPDELSILPKIKAQTQNPPPIEAVMWAPMAPPMAVVAVSMAMPIAGSEVVRKVAPAATLPASSAELIAFFPGRFSGLLGITPCSLPKAIAEPVLPHNLMTSHVTHCYVIVANSIASVITVGKKCSLADTAACWGQLTPCSFPKAIAEPVPPQ